MSGGFFTSMYPPTATGPGPTLNLVYAGAVLVAISVVTLGIGLLRTPRPEA